ncbi:hypothetical protein GRI97_10380 [Altererythrobacter xixiisoli]|uniref:Lipoprotein n=1 Tax=Croceibacterium xixiisoli TaxID=1476466 RepID=A0A6I4TTS1_9SPHN|nr:hypothetical protein [Croceibacterium xixiisoli]MXO99396.1 hypothetical protein [Croceibacterium xixiisoli]
MTQLCLRIVFLSLMALSSSACQAGEGDPALPDGVQAPDYGAVEPLRGQYL